MPKDVAFGADARSGLAAGVHKLAEAVKVTMGPRGRYVALDESTKTPGITNDGVTVAKDVDFSNHVEQMGAKMVREAAGKTDIEVGDGTTAATLLTDEIARAGLRYIAAGSEPIPIRRGIQKASAAMIDYIKKESTPVDSHEQFANVATVAVGDSHIGEKIAEAMDEVGKDGVIIVEKSQTFGIDVDVAKGMMFDRGFLSPHMADDMGAMTGELEDAYVLVTDQKITDVHDIIPVLEAVAKTGDPLLIVCQDISPEPLNTILLNKMRGVLKAVAVKGPDYMEAHEKPQTEDIAILTGATYLDSALGMKVSDASIDKLGRAKVVKITKDRTLISDGAGDPAAIEERCKQIKGELDRADTRDAKRLLRERLGKLGGGIGTLRVGAATETELVTLRRRIEDALRATQTAAREGVVAGGGIALLRSAKALDGVEYENEDERRGGEILRAVAESPLRTIAENSGFEGPVVVEKCKGLDEGCGLNAATGEYGDMIKMGVADPTEVVRTSLETAVSLASLILITEATVSDIEKESDKDGKAKKAAK